jgi:hypothetical protein
MIDPIGIWGDKNTIVEGHGRWLACKKKGIKKVPCIRLDHLTDEQRREYAIVHNKSQELAEYDSINLEAELKELDLSYFEFDLNIDIETEIENEDTTYEQKQREFEERMASGELSDDDEEYQEFLAKYEAKKTTDDCYTPPIVYEAVADYVAEKYNLNKNNFKRPFVPGGDYQSEEYKKTDVVVDNPPFSIMSEIIKFYNDNGIKFFLFAPHLTIFSSSSSASCLLAGVSIVYENGANLPTSFVTNLEDCAFRSCPELYKKVKTANDENLKQMRKQLPKYNYPLEVVTSASIAPYSRLGISFEVAKNECHFTRALDAQKESKKGLFGSGYLLSKNKSAEREKAEREKAEREKAEVWILSERERKIIDTLGK